MCNGNGRVGLKSGKIQDRHVKMSRNDRFPQQLEKTGRLMDMMGRISAGSKPVAVAAEREKRVHPRIRGVER